MRSQKAMLDKALLAADPLAGRERATVPESAERLLASIVAADPGDDAPRKTRAAQRPPFELRRRRYLVAVSLVAVLVAILIAGLPGGGEDGPSTLPVLARVAQAAAARAPLDSDPPYLYMKTRSTYTDTSVAGGGSWSVQMPTTQEEWIAKDGSGRVRTVSGPPSWVGKADREAWEGAGRISFLAHGWRRYVGEENVPPGHFHNAAPDGTPLSELPTDATALSAWLEHVVHDPKAGGGAGNGFSAAVRTLTVAAEILNNPLASPELRAALYEAEGRIPGVEYLGRVTDEAGRHGIAVGAESANSGAPTVYALVFDPKTSKVLATQQTILEAPAALANEGYPRTESTLYLESGATRSLGRKPIDPR
jgi:hypothetical protein